MLDAGGFPIAESSGCSGRYPKQWDLPCWRRVLARSDVDFVEFRMCSFGLGPPNEPGAFYQHLTRVVFPKHEPLRAALSRRCPGVSANHRHVALKGARPGSNVTRCTEAGVYCPEFVQTVCEVLRASLFVGGVGPFLKFGDKSGERAGGGPSTEGKAKATEDVQRARQPEDGEGTEGENAEEVECAEDENAEEVEGAEDEKAEEGEGTEDAERSNHLNEGEVDQDECFFQGEDEENEDDGLVIGASSESIREDDAADGDNAADGEEACGGQHDSDESFVSCDDLRANVNPARPLMEALFGAGGDHDTRGGALDQWVRRLRDEDGSLSPHHQEVTHQGVWAEEPLPESEQGPGVAGAENAEADYMQTYVGGYIVVHHCRQRQEYFYPGGLGFPVDPARLRNERMSVCTFSTGLFSRTGTAMTFEDNWRITGPMPPQEQGGGGRV